MQVNLFTSCQSNYNNKWRNTHRYNSFDVYPFAPSFKMKKGELGAVNRYVFENCFPKEQKPDIQKFKAIEEFYALCKDFVERMLPQDNNYGGRHEETKMQRKNMMAEWYNYVTQENEAYTGAMQLMILKSITKNLKQNDDTLPPVLNKGVLADTIVEMQSKLNQNEKAQLNFDKEYRLNLQKSILVEDKVLDENLNGWIIIPSYKNDSENFEANVNKLKTLSHNNWCTKSFNAEPYLKEGDFHVYMEKGKPKLGVRFIGDEIQEIQGENNNSKIPIEYSNIALEHIKNYELTSNAETELKKLDLAKAEIKKIKSKFPNGLENASTQEILEALGIKCKKDKDGLLIVSHYGSCKSNCSYSDLAIDENKLFKDIKAIEGDAIFEGTRVTDLGNLQSIGGCANFSSSRVLNLGNLRRIGKDADFRNSQITNLAKLESIGNIAWFTNSQVTNLGNLRLIGGSAHFSNSKITDLGNLESIGENAHFDGSQVVSLGNLKTIGRRADFHNSKITSLNHLQSIGEAAWLYDSQITDLGDLRSIGDDVDFHNSKITSLGKLESIGGWADFRNSQVKDLGNLKFVGGKVFIGDSYLTKKDFDSIDVRGQIK